MYAAYFTRNSKNITLVAQPTNTMRTMSVTVNVPAMVNCYSSMYASP